MENVVLKEAFNNLSVTGILAEKQLEIKEINGKPSIVGELVIKTGENNLVKLRVFSSQYTRDGGESKAFKAFTTVMDEYKSIAETGNEETADKVSAIGKVTEGKPYMNQKGEVVAYKSNQVSFISRVTDMTKYEPSAKWNLEVFVQGYKNEVKKIDGEMMETGRKILMGVVPVYGGKVYPSEFVLEEGVGADWFEENVERNATVRIYCDLVSRVEKVIQGSTSGGFGRREPQVFTNVINEVVIAGADDAYPSYEEGEENQKAFNPTAITQALAIRKQAMEEVKENASTTTTATTATTTSKVGFGGTSSTPVTQSSFMDEEEIPF